MRIDYGALLCLAERGVRRALHAEKMAWQEERCLVFVAAYLGPSQNSRQNGLVISLRDMGYTVKICENTLAGHSKSNTDLIMLGDAHALIYSNKVDVLVLATADSDFYLALQTARILGVQVELVSVEGQVVREFTEMADHYADCRQAGLLRSRSAVGADAGAACPTVGSGL